MATHEEKQAYVDEIRKRGYVLDYHKVMARHDFDVLQAANGLVDAAYLKERRLDRKTKELIFVASRQQCGRAGHTSRATYVCGLDLGLFKEEILEAIEISCPRWLVAFQEGFEAWREGWTPRVSNLQSMHMTPQPARTSPERPSSRNHECGRREVFEVPM